MDLLEAKKYLQIDYDDEDDFINLCIENAESFLTDAIDDFDTKKNNQRFANKAKLVEMTIIKDLYDNRLFAIEGDERYKSIVNSIIGQMRYCTYE